LVVGICFGVGYGLTHRLLALQWPSLVRLGQGFDVRAFPGTSLESLRLRFGAESQEIRGDLDLLELEQQTKAANPAANPEAKPVDPAVEAEAQPPEPEPQLNPEPAPEEAPPPPALPGADLPQSSPEAGSR
jgi:hypothetical protein